jgi:hypothetical protein
MKNIDYLTENQTAQVIENLKNRLIKSCIDFNPKANNFVFEYDIINNCVFCLLTCDTGSEIMPKMYRMLTKDTFNPLDIYFDGNVSSGYTLQDVKDRTKQYVNSIAKDINAMNL